MSLDNFNGKRHILTKNDSVKGGKSRTDKKIYRSRTNPIKKGKNVKIRKHCDKCTIQHLCPQFEEGNYCSMYSSKFVQKVMLEKSFVTFEQFDNFVFNFIQKGLKAQQSDSFEVISDFLHALLEWRQLKYESDK